MYIVSGGFSCTLCFLEISKGLGHLNRLDDYLSQENWNCKMKKSCCHSRPFFQHVPPFATCNYFNLIIPEIILILGSSYYSFNYSGIIGTGLPSPVYLYHHTGYVPFSKVQFSMIAHCAYMINE